YSCSTQSPRIPLAFTPLRRATWPEGAVDGEALGRLPVVRGVGAGVVGVVPDRGGTTWADVRRAALRPARLGRLAHLQPSGVAQARHHAVAHRRADVATLPVGMRFRHAARRRRGSWHHLGLRPRWQPGVLVAFTLVRPADGPRAGGTVGRAVGRGGPGVRAES